QNCSQIKKLSPARPSFGSVEPFTVSSYQCQCRSCGLEPLAGDGRGAMVDLFRLAAAGPALVLGLSAAAQGGVDQCPEPVAGTGLQPVDRRPVDAPAAVHDRIG